MAENDDSRMTAPAWSQKVAYALYRAATRAATPLIYAHVQWRRLRGLEHPSRWPERFGRPSSPRPPGPLLWFHAVSLGEGLAAIPLINHCLRHSPKFIVLMTTTTASAFEVIKDRLPHGVIYQFAPVDTPVAVEDFLGYWKPAAIFLMESELWPNLVITASEKGIPVTILNARVSSKSYKRWSKPVALPLMSLMLSKLSLIVSLSTVQAIRFKLLHAPPSVINCAGDLKYAVGDDHVPEKELRKIEDLKLQLANRPIWMAASIHKGEEEVMLWVHKRLKKAYHNLVTILVMRHPQHGQQIARVLKRQGLNVALRSKSEIVSPSTSFYVVDTLGELRTLYRITPIAVIGGSFLPDLTGHNISEAMAAGCAVLTGPYIGHFSNMLKEMKRSDALSVLQVGEKRELFSALSLLLGNAEALEARRKAARRAFAARSNGIVQDIWNLVDAYVCRNLLKQSEG